MEDDEESLVARMRRESYRSLRSAAPGTPRWLASTAKSCLRGKPTRRLESAAALRRKLERRLDAPAPPDARAELASWLWERHVHEANDGETVVRVALEPVRSRSRRGRWLAATAICGALFAGLMFIDAHPETGDESPSALRRGWNTLASWDVSGARDWFSELWSQEADPEPADR